MTRAHDETGPAAQLLRLVYLSTASAPNGPDVIEDILQASGPRNLQAGITGVLCGGYQHFLQVLEGPERAVLALYTRVADDPRHRNPILLSIELITQRLFANWSMAYIAGSPETDELYETLALKRHVDQGKQQVAALTRSFIDQLKAAQTHPLVEP